ncbi:sarcosine oxidase subunit gamma [Maritalea sp. S77]|uniref:sarcosine oxidase subunit gamma n=1 Tax=Maritalea sp. S77 TaxID=3415125 RepID=UPI003C7A2C09
MSSSVAISPDQGVGESSLAIDKGPAVELIGEKSRFNLRLREKDIAAFSEATGIALPAKIGSTHRDDALLIMCLAPDEWLIITEPEHGAEIAKKCEAYTSSPFSLVDVSHRNVGFQISGEGAAHLINVGCPLDLDLKAFPVGKCTRTIFERAEIVLSRDAETVFCVEIWRSFAPYFLSLLSNGAQPQ